MATLADLLRAGYTPPTESALADPIKEHFRTLPQKFVENQQHQMDLLAKAFPGDTYKSQMLEGDPKALAELGMQAPIVGLTAYHGTPHKILGKFDISKVGTGEGAQAYGHGMYFAENPAVAKQYIVNAELQKTPEGIARSYAQTYPSEKEALVGAKQRLERLLDNGDIAEAKLQEQVVNALESGKLGGNLYKVDIPDKDIPNMLDWDKPLSQQPKSVQKALETLDYDLYSPKGGDYDAAELGQSIYYRLRNLAKDKINQEISAEKLALLNKYNAKSFQESKMSKEDNARFHELLNQEKLAIKPSEKQVSEMLNSVGVKGIRYLDEGSRNAKQGTSNFVVFDPSTVKILEENAKPVSRKELIEKQVNKLKD